MNTEKKLVLGIVASGGGTDFEAIATGWKNGQIPNVTSIILYGTKEGAGCFKKAANHQVPSCLISCSDKNQVQAFNQRLKTACERDDINLLFLAGCVWEIDTNHLHIPVFNIHPADTKNHGGRHMYGLAPHLHVLLNIKDQIYREVRGATDNFFTQICVHQVSSDKIIDGGQVIISLAVPIPVGIILNLMDKDIGNLAGILQKHVLKYEHLLLPGAVNILAQRLLDGYQ